MEVLRVMALFALESPPAKNDRINDPICGIGVRSHHYVKHLNIFACFSFLHYGKSHLLRHIGDALQEIHMAVYLDVKIPPEAVSGCQTCLTEGPGLGLYL